MPSSDYTPTVADVGSLLWSRTVDTNGSELGTFTPNTRPTDAQVTLLIAASVGEVEAQAGKDISVQFQSLAKTAAIYRAASLVEISFFPEQVASGRSPYDQLHTLWTETIATVVEAVSHGPDSPSAGIPAAPVYVFPDRVPSLDRVLSAPLYYWWQDSPPYSGELFQ